VLVPPASLERARQVLRRLGFHLREDRLPAPDEPVHAEPWSRTREAPLVDLHQALFGIAVDPQAAWALVSEETETKRIAGTPVELPRIPVRALIVALHAAQHGPTLAKPIEDLSRALRRATPETWAEAARLADRLNATLTLSSGLGLVPEGERLAAELGLPDPAWARAALKEDTPLVAGIDRFGRARGARAKATVAARLLVPSPGYMRWAARGAADTWAGLARAYGRRLVRIVSRSVPALRALRRASAPPRGQPPAP
jgi:hypothetical protein